MSGQVLERFLGRTVEVEHTLDWRDTTFTATLEGWDRDFILFRFDDNEVIAVKRTRVLWLSDTPDRGDPEPEPQPAELDLEVWGKAFD
jgi:hypothetical protein